MSEKTIWSWIRAGKFPKPIPLSEGIRVWRVEEINEWISKKEEGITHE